MRYCALLPMAPRFLTSIVGPERERNAGLLRGAVSRGAGISSRSVEGGQLDAKQGVVPIASRDCV
jgi:hypothetical protein